MNKYKFELNRKGVRELLKSSEMEKIINDKTENVYSRVNNSIGYEMEIKQGQNRVIGTVKATTPHATNDNNKYNTLLKALH